MKKRILIVPLGCLGHLLGSTLGVPLLLILLCVSLVPHFATSQSSSGPETGSNTNGEQTQLFTGNKNDAVVDAARTLVKTLYPCDDGHYKCYTANFPSSVLQYLNSACGDPHCPYAQSGNFQCVFFVLGVYHMAGQPLPAGPNAVDFWATYRGLSGWLEIPASGAPRPGDIAVFSGSLANPFGHVAIIIDVTGLGPDETTGGFIQLAQANGLRAVEHLPLLKTNLSQDHSLWRVIAWNGYNLLGYIRNAANA